MKLQDLVNDPKNSLAQGSLESINRSRYSEIIEHLTSYRFWKGDRRRDVRSLWEHQAAGLALASAYICADANLPAEGAPEAALLKMPTGTGKSGVVAILARCLPDIKKVLILTPRDALASQLENDVRWRFWQALGLCVEPGRTFVAGKKDMGAELPEAVVCRLWPRQAAELSKVVASHERVVIVGTFQALNQIRIETATGRSADKEELIAQLGSFDLVIVDEAHYEPAPSWSRAVREFALPTILLSATPYRNDYKSFRVRGRYVFNLSIDEATRKRVIRIVDFKTMAAKGANDIERFVAMLSSEAPNLLSAAKQYTKNPKLIVRVDEFSKGKVLQTKLAAALGSRPLFIHHQIAKVDITKRQFPNVDSARNWPEAASTQCWIHETKLLEGIDDSSFVAVAILDRFQNARQLVQQIGRAIRTTEPGSKSAQTAYVLALPELERKLKDSWTRYTNFEKYASVDPTRLVEAEGALPDRLLENLPDYQYVAGEFRPKFAAEQANASDFRLPASASVMSLTSDFELEAAAREVHESLLNEDRFKPVRIDGLPANAVGFAYYGWRSSPYLSLQYFPEWTLGVCVLVQVDDLLLVCDSGGIVFCPSDICATKPERNVLQRLMPHGSEKRPVRINRMSTFSLDTSDRAIRSMSIRSRSIADTVDLLDPVMVPTTTSGYVHNHARYVGFSRARVSEKMAETLPLLEFCKWTNKIAMEIKNEDSRSNVVFDRYAKLRGPLTHAQANPRSILLDLDGDLLGMDDEQPNPNGLDVDFDDLCADVEEGSFKVKLGGVEYSCEIEFDAMTQRYKLRSDALDQKYPAIPSDDGRPAVPFTTWINRDQAYRIIVAEKPVVYAGRRFYEPNLEYKTANGDIPILANVVSVPVLGAIDSEKGERLYSRRREEWSQSSLFGVVHSICQARRGRASWGQLYNDLRGFDIVICDDDSQEIGDFVAIDNRRKRVALIHAKVADGASMSTTALQVVGRQVLASLAFCSSVAREAKVKPGRWATRVNANGVQLNLNRVFRNAERLRVPELEGLASSVLADRSWNREIWILAGSLMSRSAVEQAIHDGPGNQANQFLMYLDSLITGCARVNSTLKIYCH